ncbi:hypothetical protein Ddc_22188 [Ditylenchus destructor]|nr:hypothetical protein Ddc_22188 [Ditylenchus destructor]
MRRSGLLTGKQTQLNDKVLEEPKTIRSNNRITNIATLDNDTTVEVFKYLDYCGLAKNSLTSKRFWSLIRTHRHKLALLYVDIIYMGPSIYATDPIPIKIFDKELTPETYNEWAARNNYSKQISFEDSNSLLYEYKLYDLDGIAFYKDPNHREEYDRTAAFSARAELSTKQGETRAVLNRENWPLFQHFVCLLADPFVYIRRIVLIAQNDVLNLLAGAMDPDRSHLKCEELVLFSNNTNLEDNVRKYINWIKGHVRCNKFDFHHNNRSNFNEELFDFFVTGAHCTSEITTNCCDVSKVIIDFVQHFMDLKNCDEHQLESTLKSIKCNNADSAIAALWSNYREFLVKSEEIEMYDVYVLDYELINNNIKKKLELDVTDYDSVVDGDTSGGESSFSLKITDL